MSVAQQGIADQITYDDLYRRWEEGNWKSTEIDFSEDRKGWEALSEIQRKSALWTYSMFFYGEDSVTDNLSPYIDAAPKEEQKYFLATQQVDEARHTVFFARFFDEVMGGPGSGPAPPPPPHRLLRPLLRRGDGRARLDGRPPRGVQARVQLGLQHHLRAPRPDGGRAAQGQVAAQVRAGHHHVPPGGGGRARPARPA